MKTDTLIRLGSTLPTRLESAGTGEDKSQHEDNGDCLP